MTVSLRCVHGVVAAGVSAAAASGVAIEVRRCTVTVTCPASSLRASGSQSASSRRPERVAVYVDVCDRLAQTEPPFVASPSKATPSTYSRPCDWSGTARSSDACDHQVPPTDRQRPSVATPLPRSADPSTVRRYSAPCSSAPAVSTVPLAAGTATVSLTRPVPSWAAVTVGAAARVGTTGRPEVTLVVLRETSTRREPVAPVGLFATWSLSGPVTLGFTVTA